MRAEIGRLVEDQAVGRAAEEASFDVEQSTARLAELNKLAETLTSGMIRRSAEADAGTDLAEDSLVFRHRQGRARARDNVGMIELGEAENDEGVVAEAETALKNLKRKSPAANSKRCCGRSRPVSTPTRSPRRRGGTESQDWPRCCCGCIRAGPESMASRSNISRRPRAKSRHQVGHHPDQRSQRLWLAENEAGVHRLVRFRRSIQCARHTSFSSVAIFRWSTTASRSISPESTSASTPCARGRRRPACQQTNPRCG